MWKRSILLIAAVLCVLASGCVKEQRGAELFKANRCIECHTIKGKGGTAGPNLTFIGKKRSRDYIIVQIKNPSRNYPNTAMPSFSSLPEKDINDLADYLAGLK